MARPGDTWIEIKLEQGSRPQPTSVAFSTTVPRARRPCGGGPATPSPLIDPLPEKVTPFRFQDGDVVKDDERCNALTARWQPMTSTAIVLMPLRVDWISLADSGMSSRGHVWSCGFIQRRARIRQ